MAHAPAASGLRLSSYDASGLARVADHLGELHPSAADGPSRLAELARLDGFALVTAAQDAHLVGYAAVCADGGVQRIEPLVLAPALAGGDAERVAHELLSALLHANERPWAQLAVPASSPALPLLLRDGWRPLPGPAGSGDVLLTGAEAQA